MQSERVILGFRISAVCLAASTLSLLLLGFCEASTLLAYFLAGVFWGGLIFQQLTFWLGDGARKRLEAEKPLLPDTGSGRPGICTFWSNREATICDWVMIGSTLAVLLEILLKVESEALLTVSLTVLYLSVHLHCILNGRNYQYLVAYFNQKKGA